MAVSSFVHEQKFIRTCKHRSRIYIYIYGDQKGDRAQQYFVYAHMSRTCVLYYSNVKLSVTNVSFVREQMSFKRKRKHRLRIRYLVNTYRHEKGARSHLYDMSSHAFVHAPMLYTRVLYYYKVLSRLLAISLFVREQMLCLDRKCKHRSRV